ncbi:MAG: GNAT family N-acetyltransferase [Lachnospiraceae bacterium]|nr:GNAT family N-acetyltransferase [Lachnospiraceae bacterium]
MFSKDIKIRTAGIHDAQALLEIYAPYVRNTAITFEYEVPKLADFQKRIENTLKKYPYIVAEADGEILGYAYMGAFKERAAYDWSAEVSIYVKEDKHGNGVGRKLYAALEEISHAQHILNLNACIACSDMEDGYLTNDSVTFHSHMRYTMVGKFHQCGYKFGRWYDMVWMEKMVGEHPADPAPVIRFPDLSWTVNTVNGMESPKM